MHAMLMPVETRREDMVFRSPTNWTAVGFLTLLGLAHFIFAVRSFSAGHWEAHLSLLFGACFLGLGVACVWLRTEVAVLARERIIRVRTGVGRWSEEEQIPFHSARGVRLTLSHAGKREESLTEILMGWNGIECPPVQSTSHTPRQAAFELALLLDVPFISVSDEPAPREPLDFRCRGELEKPEARSRQSF